ncbi:KTSC domain-containing protein [Salinarchaeum chitinilyticum]
MAFPSEFGNMNRTPVSSSDLDSVGYDQDNQILEVEFNSGGVYQYFDVPPRIYEGLMNASSHGSYFHSQVKDNFRYDQIR